MKNLSRIKQLAGLNESLDDDDYSQTASNYETEKKIARVVLQVFLKIGFDVAESHERYGIKLNDNAYESYEVVYDLDSNEASVALDGCTAAQVVALNGSGLSTEYKFSGASNGLMRAEFKVNSNIVSGAAKLDM